MESEQTPIDKIDPETTVPVQVPVSGAPADQPVEEPTTSPRWSPTTKLVVGLGLVGVSLVLLIRFLNIVGPLLLAVVLAYLLYPIADNMRKYIKIPWRGAVTILYVFLLLLVLGSIAAGGLALIEQVQNLINFLQNAVRDLPVFLAEITSKPLEIGPFTFNLQLLEVNTLAQQLLGIIQPVLTQAGSSVVTVASSAATFIGWIFFILLVSYFMLAESGGIRLFSINVPGYADDIHRLGIELNRIWEAFLRGQVTIVLITIVVYNILLGALGMKFFLGLALLAGLARFIPYVGPFIAWTTYGIVAYFQGSTIFGLSPLAYVILVVGLAWIVDVILDNVVVPRLMANALRVHPAAVMISAIVALNLLGVAGVVMAAPVLATIKLFLDYTFAKLFDVNPWTGMATLPPPEPLPPFVSQIGERYAILRDQISRVVPPRSK